MFKGSLHRSKKASQGEIEEANPLPYTGLPTNMVSKLPGYYRTKRKAEACLRGEERTEATAEEGRLATMPRLQYSSSEELWMQPYCMQCARV
jgi:hypothetical protein